MYTNNEINSTEEVSTYTLMQLRIGERRVKPRGLFIGFSDKDAKMLNEVHNYLVLFLDSKTVDLTNYDKLDLAIEEAKKNGDFSFVFDVWEFWLAKLDE